MNQRGMITNTNYQHLLEDVEKSLGLVRSSADTEVTSLITDHDAVSLPVPSAGPPRRQRICKLSQSVESCRLPFSALLVLFYGHKNLFVVVCFGLSPPDSLSRRRAPAGKGWREQTEQRMKNKAAASSLSAAWFRLHPPVSVHIFSVCECVCVNNNQLLTITQLSDRNAHRFTFSFVFR